MEGSSSQNNQMIV